MRNRGDDVLPQPRGKAWQCSTTGASLCTVQAATDERSSLSAKSGTSGTTTGHREGAPSESLTRWQPITDKHHPTPTTLQHQTPNTHAINPLMSLCGRLDMHVPFKRAEPTVPTQRSSSRRCQSSLEVPLLECKPSHTYLGHTDPTTFPHPDPHPNNPHVSSHT